jgi:hypothetical protein
MKKILSVLAALTVASSATSGTLLPIQNNQATGVIQNTIFAAYKVADSELPQTDVDTKVLAHMAHNKVCMESDLKKMIEQGISFQYIYIADKNIAVIVVDKCN